MKHNRRIPPRVLKRILRDPHRLVGTYWTYVDHVPYKILDVSTTAREVQVSAINPELQSKTLLLGEVLGETSLWSYEGTDLAWAAPGRFVKEIRDQGGGYVYKVMSWCHYRTVLQLNPRTGVYESFFSNVGDHGLCRNYPESGRIRGVVEPVSQDFMDSTNYSIVAEIKRTINRHLVNSTVDYVHTRFVPTSNLEASLMAIHFTQYLQRIFEREESLEDILRILDEHKSQPPVSSDIISPDVPTKSALDRLLEDEPE